MSWEPIESMPQGRWYLVKVEAIPEAVAFVNQYQGIFYTHGTIVWPYQPTHWLKP